MAPTDMVRWARDAEAIGTSAAMLPGRFVLGATAAQAVFGSDHRVTREHGRFRQLPDGTWATAKIHPSAVLPSQNRRRRSRSCWPTSAWSPSASPAERERVGRCRLSRS